MATSSISTGQSASSLIVASGDALTVDSGGFIQNTTVQSGGSLIVSGEADTTIIQSGGVLTVSSGGTTSHTTLAAVATLLMRLQKALKLSSMAARLWM